MIWFVSGQFEQFQESALFYSILPNTRLALLQDLKYTLWHRNVVLESIP